MYAHMAGTPDEEEKPAVAALPQNNVAKVNAEVLQEQGEVVRSR